MNPIEYEPLHFKLASGIRFEKYILDYQKSYHIKSHFHETMEIILYRKYTGSITIQNKKYNLKAPFVLFFPQFFIHELEILPGEYEAFLISFTKPYLKTIKYERSLPQIPLLCELDDSETKYLWNSLDWYHDLQNKQDKTILQHDIFHTILDFIQFKSKPNTPNNKQEKSFLKFTPLLSYLETNEIFDLEVKKAAEISGLSRSHFLALFKKIFNNSFHKFLLNRRINISMHLLAETQQNITQISRYLGFFNSAHFTKTFKNHMNTTPTTFRKVAKEQTYLHDDRGKTIL